MFWKPFFSSLLEIKPISKVRVFKTGGAFRYCQISSLYWSNVIIYFCVFLNIVFVATVESRTILIGVCAFFCHSRMWWLCPPLSPMQKATNPVLSAYRRVRGVAVGVITSRTAKHRDATRHPSCLCCTRKQLFSAMLAAVIGRLRLPVHRSLEAQVMWPDSSRAVTSDPLLSLLSPVVSAGRQTWNNNDDSDLMCLCFLKIHMCVNCMVAALLSSSTTNSDLLQWGGTKERVQRRSDTSLTVFVSQMSERAVACHVVLKNFSTCS
jgi:hypothetical protein